MKTAEKLYTQGYISYPRTETNIFPKELDLAGLVSLQTQDNRWGGGIELTELSSYAKLSCPSFVLLSANCLFLVTQDLQRRLFKEDRLLATERNLIRLIPQSTQPSTLAVCRLEYTRSQLKAQNVHFL